MTLIPADGAKVKLLPLTASVAVVSIRLFQDLEPNNYQDTIK